MQLSELDRWKQELKPHWGAFAAALGAIGGAGVYFGLSFDPFWGWGLLAVGIGLLLTGVYRLRHAGVGVGVAGAVFVLAAWQVARVDMVDFAKAQKPHWLVGRVVEVFDKGEDSNRATLRLDRVDMYGLGAVRVSAASIGVFKSQLKEVNVGEGVALPVVLMAPEGPKFEGQRDGRLWRFFGDGKVTGYVLGTVEPTYLPEVATGPWARMLARIEGYRSVIYERTKGLAGGTVAALLVGEEKGITPEIRDAYRATGLSHLLAISGMQMTLVALGIFGLVRWLGALVPWVALRVNVRFWSAVVALAATFFYTLLAGASVSLVRASIMAGFVMLAVVFGRISNALRGWCVAVVVVLAVSPVLVTRAGFQLSVVAVLGLVLLAMGERGRWRGGLWDWARALGLSTLVAGAATAPVLVGYFGQFSAVGMLANLLAGPVMTVATYLGMLGLLLWPIGGEAAVMEVMAAVVGCVNHLALWMAQWDYSYLVVDRRLAWVVGVFAVLAVGSILLKRWWEAAVSVVAMTGVVLVVAATAAKPEVMVWDGGNIGLRREGEVYRLLWADSRKEALRLAELAGVEVVVPEGVSEYPDERYVPVTELEHYAWAKKVAGHWEIAPIACGRVWQRMAEACWVR